ncbi:MAG TPA: hypothetical protein VH595_11955 [Verrucomicrobiae bacterium]|jgi:hypothetical protein|nr:hypothetical protein [Verrucomicrobiae bacterium]
MKNKKSWLKVGKAGIVLGALIVGTLAGPAVYADGIHADITIGTPKVVVAPDNYVYYPKYGAYYSAKRHQYYYQNHGAWVWGASPPGVRGDVVLGSPSVKMDFHDSPAHHHDDIVRKYPKDWHGDRR